MTEKLYLVVREDLQPGVQAVQAVHAQRAFVDAHPERERAWFRASNTLAFLAVPDEAALRKLMAKAAERGILAAWFEEEDLGGSVTAVAIAPEGRRLCKGLPKALREGMREA